MTQPGKLIALALLAAAALAAYFIQPANLTIFGAEQAQRTAGILLGALLVLTNLLQNQLPRFQDAPDRPPKPDPVQGGN